MISKLLSTYPFKMDIIPNDIIWYLSKYHLTTADVFFNFVVTCKRIKAINCQLVNEKHDQLDYIVLFIGNYKCHHSIRFDSEIWPFLTKEIDNITKFRIKTVKIMIPAFPSQINVKLHNFHLNLNKYIFWSPALIIFKRTDNDLLNGKIFNGDIVDGVPIYHGKDSYFEKLIPSAIKWIYNQITILNN